MINRNSKIFISILSIVLGVWLLMQKVNNDPVSSQKIGDNSIIVVDLEKKKSPNYLYLISGCLLVSIGAFYLVKPYLKESVQEKENPFDKLTEREWEIVSLIEQGMSNKEIQSQLSISLSSVKTHVNNVFKKLNIQSRSELLKALKH